VMWNEEADHLAKMATEMGSSRRRRLPAPLRKALPTSKQACSRRILAALKARTAAAWKQSPQHAKFKDIDNSMPSKKYLQLVEGLPRRKASLLMQLHTGHILLLSQLHRIHRADSPICAQCNGAKETVMHFLALCPAYQGQRRLLLQEGGQHTLSVHRILNDAKLLPHLFCYIACTGRFCETFGDLEETGEDGN